MMDYDKALDNCTVICLKIIRFINRHQGRILIISLEALLAI